MTYTTVTIKSADEFSGEIGRPGALRRVPLSVLFPLGADGLERFLADHIQHLGGQIGFKRLFMDDYSPDNGFDVVNHIAVGEVEGDEALAAAGGRVAIKAVLRGAQPRDLGQLLYTCKRRGLTTGILIAEDFPPESMDEIIEISHGYIIVIAVELQAYTLDGATATPCFTALPRE